MTTFFLSYARTNQEIALRFADDLIEAGVSVWVDQYDILPSQHWDQAVETALRGCRGMLVMLSPASVASPNVADEVAVALDSGKQVVPVLIEPCILPLRMTRMQFIDATGDYQTALRRCLSFMREETDPLARRDRKAAPATRLDPEALRTAERRLTSVMGPIAGRLVAAAAAQASSLAELYARLAESIPSEAERKSFLHWIAEPAGAPRVVTPRQPKPDASEPLTPEDLQAIAKALTRYLGPIAGRLVDREKGFAESRADLCRRLAERVSREAERAAFLKDVDAA
jgi:TIR domain